jgi:uncharacterized membrane protein (DUF485 family)
MSDIDDDELIEEEEEETSEKKGGKKEQLPVLLDLIFNLSNFLIILVAVVVAFLSYIAGASVLNIALRTGVAIIVVGFLSTTIARKIAGISIEVTNDMLENAQQSNDSYER